MKIQYIEKWSENKNEEFVLSLQMLISFWVCNYGEWLAVAPATSERDDDMDHVGKFINAAMFIAMFKHIKRIHLCQSQGFYSYEAFLAAAG